MHRLSHFIPSFWRASPARESATILLTFLGFTAPVSNSSAAEPSFPIGVWLQSPANAPRYQAAGINTFVGLWQGPTQAQLDNLQPSGLKVVCTQNDVALTHPYRTNIVAWSLPDEPDNSPLRGARLGRGNPISTEAIAAQFRELKSRDPHRPVFLNLGQGVAWPNWYGRGTRNGRMEDYPRYLESCDIASFDIYPVNHPDAEVRGNLWYVANGIRRSRELTENRKPVWSFIECTAIENAKQRPTPTEVRAEVWMALIHGANGIVYFAHQFRPTFVEAALLADAEMLAAITAINREITTLAPVLNRPATTNVVHVRSEPAQIPIALTARETDDSLYIFAVAMRPGDCHARFSVNAPRNRFQDSVDVIGEGRSLTITNGSFADRFTPWQVHLYRIGKRAGHSATP